MKSVRLGFYLNKLKPVYDVAQWTENLSVPGRFRFTRVLEVLDPPDCGIFLLKTLFVYALIVLQGEVERVVVT